MAAQFRQACRALGLIGASNAASDADVLFSSLDLDGGGDVSLKELTQAIQTTLKKDEHAATEHANAAKRTREQRDRLVGRAEIADVAAAATAAAEGAVAELSAYVESLPVALRVEALFAKRGIKATDLVQASTPNAAWRASTGDVVMSPDEVVAGLSGLGVEASTEELAAWVVSLDTNGSGSIELSEMKMAIKALAEQRVELDCSIAAMRTRADELRKVAARKQAALREREAVDAAAEAAAETAQTQAHAEVQAAADAKLAAVRQAKAQAAAEQVEFEARVEGRRSKTGQMRRKHENKTGAKGASPSSAR